MGGIFEYESEPERSFWYIPVIKTFMIPIQNNKTSTLYTMKQLNKLDCVVIPLFIGFTMGNGMASRSVGYVSGQNGIL